MKRAPLLIGLAMSFGCASSPGIKGPIGSFAEAGVTASAAQPKRFALIVGIDRFDDERFLPLRYARADAQALGLALTGFDEVRVLATPKETTRTSVLAALDELARKATDPLDTVVIYFSTHGSLSRPAGGALNRYIVASDTRMNLLPDTGISVDRLIERTTNIPSKRKALILAMCHSGRGKSKIDDALSRALALQKSSLAPLALVSEAVVVTTASAFSEVARESDKLGHDIYTYFLLQALKLGDRDRDGAVTISEAHDFARERTYAFSGGKQRPTSQSDILGKDPIVLSGKRARLADPVIYSYAPSAEGVAVWVDGSKKGVLPGGVAIEPGTRSLRLQDESSGALLYEGKVVLEKGQVEDLSQLLKTKETKIQVAGFGGATVPLSSVIRKNFLPPSFGGGARASLRNWPLEGLEFSARFSYSRGRGETQGFDEALPFVFDAYRLALGVGYAFELGAGLALVPGAQAGLLWAKRTLSTDAFQKEESLRGATLFGQLLVDWTVGAGVGLGLVFEVGGLFARLADETGPHGMISVEATAGYSF